MHFQLPEILSPVDSFFEVFRRDWRFAQAEAKTRGKRARLFLMAGPYLYIVGNIQNLDGQFMAFDAVFANDTNEACRLYLHHSDVQLMIMFVSQDTVDAEPEERRRIGFDVRLSDPDGTETNE